MSTAAGRFYRGSYLHLRRASKPVLLSVELQVDSQKARPFALNGVALGHVQFYCFITKIRQR